MPWLAPLAAEPGEDPNAPTATDAGDNNAEALNS
jgi:hypothetical protein